MDTIQHTLLLTAIALMLTLTTVSEAMSDEKYNKWQLNRLFEPSQTQLHQEQKGRVFIYEGLKDKDVNRVLAEQFDRVDTMMFIGTIITDQAGKPKKDSESGLVLKEDDDC